MPARTVLLDTSYIVALENRDDPYHGRAKTLDRQLLAEGATLLLHWGILLEIGERVRPCWPPCQGRATARQNRTRAGLPFVFHLRFLARRSDWALPRAIRQRLGVDRLHLIRPHAAAWGFRGVNGRPAFRSSWIQGPSARDADNRLIRILVSGVSDTHTANCVSDYCPLYFT